MYSLKSYCGAFSTADFLTLLLFFSPVLWKNTSRLGKTWMSLGQHQVKVAIAFTLLLYETLLA